MTDDKVKEWIEIYRSYKQEFEESIVEHQSSYKKLMQLFLKFINHHKNEDRETIKLSLLDVDECYDGDILIIFYEGWCDRKYYISYLHYGSCSGCDALEAINSYSETPTEEQRKAYSLLCLHVLQRMTKIEFNEVDYD